MFVALWEFEVKPRLKKRFQKVYGPGGDWAKLFRSDSHYQEAQLLHDPEHPAIFLTLDFWTSREAYENFRASHAAEYERLDAVGEALTRREENWMVCERRRIKPDGGWRSRENRTESGEHNKTLPMRPGLMRQNSRSEKQICCQATFG